MARRWGQAGLGGGRWRPSGAPLKVVGVVCVRAGVVAHNTVLGGRTPFSARAPNGLRRTRSGSVQLHRSCTEPTWLQLMPKLEPRSQPGAVKRAPGPALDAEQPGLTLDEASDVVQEASGRTLETDRSVFINTHLTLKSVDTSKQTFSVSGYVNALWRCPDLEHESLRDDYYARDHVGTTIKNGLAQASKTSSYRCCIDREYVQKEIRWALKYNKPIITVFEKDADRAGYFDYKQAWEKYRGTEWEFLLRIDATQYCRDYLQAGAMLEAIYSKAKGSTPGSSRTNDVSRAQTAPAALGHESDEALNQPGHWNFFLSHNQAHGGDQASTMHLRFKEHGYTSWYDMAMLDKSEAAMEEGVKNSDYFVLVLTGADDRSAHDSATGHGSQGYVHSSQGRSYVDGFKLSFDHWYSTPFNPNRMFDNAIVETSQTKSCSFYYYPTAHGNDKDGKKCGGLVKMAVQFEATLTHRIDMQDFPFDGQILRLAFFVRNEWKVLSVCPGWVDTGYKSDTNLCKMNLSEAVVHYKLEEPWLMTKSSKSNAAGSGYIVDIRVQRKYKYELRTIVLPLFVLVLIASASFGLEPESTNDRVIVPAVMTLAISGFFQVIQKLVPNQPTMTKLDKYVIFCWIFLIFIVMETLAVKLVLEYTRFVPTGEDSADSDSPCTSQQQPPQWCPRMGEVDRTSSTYRVAEVMDKGAVCCVLLFW
eukprot:COSAG02_NODE_1864_length_10606_cov_17.350148_11_plen_701_part_00